MHDRRRAARPPPVVRLAQPDRALRDKTHRIFPNGSCRSGALARGVLNYACALHVRSNMSSVASRVSAA